MSVVNVPCAVQKQIDEALASASVMTKREMKQYTLVCEDDFTAFVDEVNARMAEGYMPLGGLVKERFDHWNDGLNEVRDRYYQAMVLQQPVPYVQGAV